MKHNLHGDISEEHQKLAEELLELEEYFEDHKDTFLPKDIAKGYVALAHDWYLMGDDEKGFILLNQAENICPGYFDKVLPNDIDEDPLYKLLVDNLASTILDIAKSISEGHN